MSQRMTENASDPARLAGAVEPGMSLALPVDYAGVSMAMTRALLARRAGDLHIINVPTGGMQGDILIGSGLVRSVETSAMTLGEAGGAPCFNRAVKSGRIKLKDATCPAIHAGLMAAQKGSPFMPMRGLLETDILKFRDDWKVIDNPFDQKADPIVLIPAIKPDVAIFHAPMADRHGNVWIGRRRELAAMAYASTTTLVTVERVVENSLLADEVTAAGTLPALYVSDIAVAQNGAWPYGLWGEYPTDTEEIMRYADAAKTEAGFADYISGRMMDVAA